MKFTTIYNDPRSRSTKTYSWTYWDDGFSEEELKKVIEYCDSLKLINATTIGAGEDIEKARESRKSNISWIHRNEESAWIFDKLNYIIQNSNERYFNFDLNGYDSIQYTEYTDQEEGNYGWHMDMCMNMPLEYGENRKLSLTLLLDDDFEGGEFEINKGNEKDSEIVTTKKGRAIIFPSWMIHQVRPVTKGKRKSLVVWVLGPKFQ